MRNILQCHCGPKFAAFAALFLRVVVGVIFLVHGWQKLEGGVAGTAGFLATLGFPAPEFFAVLLIAAEVIGGALLIIGLLTHWAAKILAIVALVALVTVHLKNGFLASAGGYEFILLILAATLSVMAMGGGKWSVDAHLKK